MQPFTCPHCGSHAYTIVLSGCTLSNATLQESFEWNETEKEYVSGGTIVAETEELTPQESEAVCSECDKDVTEAVAAYEASLSEEDGAAD